jgi:hypothetical protein
MMPPLRIHDTYLGAPVEILTGVAFPVRSLAVSDCVHLKSGEVKTVLLHVAQRQLQ